MQRYAKSHLEGCDLEMEGCWDGPRRGLGRRTAALSTSVLSRTQRAGEPSSEHENIDCTLTRGQRSTASVITVNVSGRFQRRLTCIFWETGQKEGFRRKSSLALRSFGSGWLFRPRRYYPTDLFIVLSLRRSYTYALPGSADDRRLNPVCKLRRITRVF